MSAVESPTARRIFQPVRGRGVRKLLWKRLHIPRAIVHPALSAAKAAANPAQVRLRRRLAEELRATSTVPPIEDAMGYRLVAPGELPGSDAAVSRCREVYEAMRRDASVDDHVFNPRKRFLLALLSGPDFCAHPDLLRFMVSRPVLDTAALYLGSIPLLAGAALWWTPDNESAERSQLYHFDGEDERQLKLVLNITETREDSGPFTLIAAERSSPIRRKESLRKRITDDQVDAVAGLANAVQLVGPPGSGGFVDTSRCLHFGSRHARRDRLVLMIQFLRFHCPTESTFDLRIPPGLPGLDPDPVQKLALGIA